jgi:hypothetical protein
MVAMVTPSLTIAKLVNRENGWLRLAVRKYEVVERVDGDLATFVDSIYSGKAMLSIDATRRI